MSTQRTVQNRFFLLSEMDFTGLSGLPLPYSLWIFLAAVCCAPCCAVQMIKEAQMKLSTKLLECELFLSQQLIRQQLSKFASVSDLEWPCFRTGQLGWLRPAGHAHAASRLQLAFNVVPCTGARVCKLSNDLSGIVWQVLPQLELGFNLKLQGGQ